MKYLFKNPRLKRSTPIFILALFFLATPIVNFPISIYFYAPDTWTEWVTWRLFLSNMLIWSKIWGISVFISGVLLLIQRKWTWLLAIITMIYSAFYTWFVIVPLGEFPFGFKILSFLSIGTALLVLSHFRFPYIDTRDYWFGIAHRFTTDNTGFPVRFLEDFGEAEVRDISITGARLYFKKAEKRPSVGTVLNIRYSDDLSLRVVVRRIVGEEVGVAFEETNARQKRAIKRLIRELSHRRGTFVIDDNRPVGKS